VSKYILKAQKDYYVWNRSIGEAAPHAMSLATTTIDFCDHCEKPAMINSVWIMSANHPLDLQKKEADRILEDDGRLTDLGADSEGNCFCENCYDDHAVVED